MGANTRSPRTVHWNCQVSSFICFTVFGTSVFSCGISEPLHIGFPWIYLAYEDPICTFGFGVLILFFSYKSAQATDKDWVQLRGKFLLNGSPSRVLIYLEGPPPGTDILVNTLVVKHAEKIPLSPPPVIEVS